MALDFDEVMADAQAIPEDERLKQVAELAEQQLALDDEIEKLEALVSEKKAQLLGISQGKLPEMMSAIGLKEFKLLDGSKITVRPYYTAKIDDENREKAHNWLAENGHADIIKHQINVALGKGEAEAAEKVTAALKALGISYTDKEAVHWQTLVAFVREQVESGGDLPLDVFKVHIGQVAKIKRG